MESIIIIPARMAATRFPGKPLAIIAGVPMISHCFLRATFSKKAKKVYVATCDTEIADEIHQLHGNVVMTSLNHERATDRTAEALEKIEKVENKKIDVVVMLQGDEPLIQPNDLDNLISHHEQFPTIPVFNLTQYVRDDDDFNNVNIVKLITNLQGDVLAFSRAPIPCPALKGLQNYKPMKQLGIISFQRDALLNFSSLPQTPLEKIESIDMMRLLENGLSIKSVLSRSPLQSVDTPADAKKAEVLLLKDFLYTQYKKNG